MDWMKKERTSRHSVNREDVHNNGHHFGKLKLAPKEIILK